MILYLFKESGEYAYYISYFDDYTLEEYQEFYKGYKLYVDEQIDNIEEYRLVDGKLERMSDNELQEMRAYGHILSYEERQTVEEEKQLAKLRPSAEEVARAENQLMMLDMLEEIKNE